MSEQDILASFYQANSFANENREPKTLEELEYYNKVKQKR